MEKQWNRQSKQDNYLAQIALETRRSYLKDPSQATLKDFFMKFQRQESMEGDNAVVGTNVVKQNWFACCGLDVEGNYAGT